MSRKSNDNLRANQNKRPIGPANERVSSVMDISGYTRGMTVRSLLPKLTDEVHKQRTAEAKTKKLRKQPEPWEFTEENPYE